jgi:putative spermidine/putrescine transport system permease protein
MKGGVLWRRIVLAVMALYIFIPLVGVAEFSLRMRRGVYSFDAFVEVFADNRFQETFLYSCTMAVITVVIGVALIVPAAYAVRLHAPRLRSFVEFVTLLPLVVPAIVIVFGYLRLYGSDSFLPLTDSEGGADALLAFGYVTLALPYIYRSVDAGLTSMDVRTLTEAAESLGARPLTVLLRIVLPNIRTAILSGAFLTAAIVLGEFTFASLLDRPAFGPYMQLLGANRAYEPAALSLVAFALTWGLMVLIGAFGGRRRGT